MISFNSVEARLVFVSFMVSLITTSCLGGIFLYYIVRENSGQLRAYREDLEKLVDARLVEQVNEAESILREMYSRQQAGLLTEAQAQKEAADLVRSLRYGGGEGYFWIDREDGVNVVLLGTEAEGKPRLHTKDPTGKELVAEIIANSKQEGGGFTDFMFPKPGTQEPLPKRAYGVFFEPWGWVVGTGVWIDNIDRMVEARRGVLAKHLRSTLFGVGFIFFVLVGFFVFLSLYIGENMARPVQIMTKHLRKMGSGDLRMGEAALEEMSRILPRRDEIGTMARAMHEMRGRLFEYQKDILDNARNDALTGLANRRRFQEYVDSAADGKRFTIVTLDLDHFKEVNDTWGHQMGDAALLILAELLRSVFPDAMNVRTGGDEFLVVLPEKVPLSDVENRLQHFMEDLVSIYRTDPGLEKLSVSAGIACSHGADLPVDLLLQRSDMALYRAKEAGRSCYRIYDESMEEQKEKG